jgi:hypothetical protein
MELTSINQNKKDKLIDEHLQCSEELVKLKPFKGYKQNPFIESNTKNISLAHLKNECIVPVFAKDNESTIPHFEFVEAVKSIAQSVYFENDIPLPDIRVSHQIKGRIPSAIGKPVQELQMHEKTQYWERMAFIIEIPHVNTILNGQELKLTIGGVRSYSEQNLYSKKSIEKFKIFIGFKNKVCTNLCINTDGLKDDLRVSSIEELKDKTLELIQGYSQQKHIEEMNQLLEYNISKYQFCHLIGKMKLYHCLDKTEKENLFEILLTDSQISNVVKEYVNDINFKSQKDGSINLWNLYNLFTNSAKSNYIDNFLTRNCNTHEFTMHLLKQLKSGLKDYYLI